MGQQLGSLCPGRPKSQYKCAPIRNAGRIRNRDAISVNGIIVDPKDDNLKYLRDRLALAFIVRNEGHYALDMLASVIDCVGFVSCVDTNSTDNTVALLDEYLRLNNLEYHLASVPFTRFDDMRNLAISQVPATFSWILMLDADEILLPADLPLMIDLISDESVDAWYLPRFNWQSEFLKPPATPYPDYQGRLFRNYPDGRITYKGVVHEGLTGFQNISAAPACEREDFSDAGLHIHHMKLLKKGIEELRAREASYRQMMEIKKVEEPDWIEQV